MSSARRSETGALFRTGRAVLVAAAVLAVATALSLTPGGSSASATITVTRFDDPLPPGACTAESCSLREAVIMANETPGHHTIVLGAGTYSLNLGNAFSWFEDAGYEGDIDITDDLTITGAGAELTHITNVGIQPERALDVHAPAKITKRIRRQIPVISGY